MMKRLKDKLKQRVLASVTAVRPKSTNNTNSFNDAGPSDNVVGPTFKIGGKSLFVDPSQYPNDPNMPVLEDIIYSDDEEDVGAEADFSNLETSITISPILITRVHKDHPITQIIGDLSSAPQTRSMTWMVKEQGGLTQINDKDFYTFARIEAIRLFLDYASFMGFMVYQMDVKSTFLYGTVKEEVYVCQPPGFEDPNYPVKVYKVVKALYGLHQAPSAWYKTLANYLLENGFQRGKIDHTLFIKKKKVMFYWFKSIWMTLYLALPTRNYGKSASTSIDIEKPLLKDPDGKDVDVHIYIYSSMIGSLMYLTSSRLDIMFAGCACARFQVTPKVSHLHAVKRIFRYLKGKPHLGLWYPKDSPFNLVVYSDSDYARASLDRKSTTEGCQFLGCRLISWQCKKQTVVATSSTEAEYVATANCCAQVLWIQNQLLDCGQMKISDLNDVHVNESQVIGNSLIDSHERDGEDNQVNDRFKKNDSVFKFAISKTVTSVNKTKTSTSKTSKEGLEKPKIVRPSAPIIKEWESESKDENVVEKIEVKKTVKPSLEKCMSAKRNALNEFSSSMASTVICLATVMINAQVNDLSSHNTKYTSLALTQKVFANMRRIGNGFLGVDTPLFDAMLVPQQVPNDIAEVEDDEDDYEVSVTPTPPLPTPTTTPPPPQPEPIPSPP
nr:hypothetical protein [Tanacetum cinerariifolium]